MRDEEKPFICYKSGKSMQIVPRGRAGWIAFIGGSLTILPLIAAYSWLLHRFPGDANKALLTVAFIAATGLWSWAFIRWMKARSEIVALDDLLQIKRERDSASRRGRR